MSEHKARAAVKLRRPTKARALQKLDFKYLLILRRRFTPPECATSLGLRRPMSGSSIHTCRTSGPWLCWASGGPAPTIKVSLQNMPFRFFFLGGLLDFRDMQTATTTMTSGDLYLLSDNEEGLLRLSVSNGAIGRFDAVLFRMVVREEKCVRSQSAM